MDIQPMAAAMLEFKQNNQRAMQSLRDALEAEPPTPEEEATYQQMMAGLERDVEDVPNPMVRTMVVKYLMSHGYDGLYCDDDCDGCSCRLGDLAPCGNIGPNCQAGYVGVCGCVMSTKGDVCDVHGGDHEDGDEY
jgi:hypothetical protein